MPEMHGRSDRSDARDDDEPGTTPELDLDQAEPDEYESVGPSSKSGRSLTIPALVVTIALIIYAIVAIAMR